MIFFLSLVFTSCYGWNLFSSSEQTEKKRSFSFTSDTLAPGYQDVIRKEFAKRGFEERKQESGARTYTQDAIWGQCSWLEQDLTWRSLRDHSRCASLPSSHFLSLKTYLHWVLHNAKRLQPSLFRHWPEGYNLEHAKEFEQLREKFHKHEKEKLANPDIAPLVYIVKNPYKNAGAGVQLISTLADLESMFAEGGFFYPMNETKPLAQRYVTNPLLVVGHKTTFRVWILITSFDPITIYRFDNGPVKFAGRKYEMNKFNDNNIHVASWAPDLIDDLDTVTLVQKLNLVGGRTDFDTLAPMLEAANFNLTQVSRDIDAAILATVFAVDRYMHSEFMRYIVGGREYRLRPFELFGLDILLDDKGKPHLLEINAMPDLRSETPLLSDLVTQMMQGLFDLVDIENKHIEKTRRVTEATWKKLCILKSVEGVPFDLHQIRNKDEWLSFVQDEFELQRSLKTGWRRLFPRHERWGDEFYNLFENERNNHAATWHSLNLSYKIIERLQEMR